MESQDISELRKLLAQLSSPESISGLVIELMIKKLEGNVKTYPKRNKKLIKKFLLNVENWDNDCLWVLSNTLEIYDLKELDGLMNWIIYNYSYFDNYDNREIQLLADISVNYLQICQDNNVSILKMKPVFAYVHKMPSLPFIFHDKLKVAAIESQQCANHADEKLINEIMEDLA